MEQTKDEIILALDQASKTGYCVLKNGEILSYGVLNLDDIKSQKYGDTYYDEKVENVKQFLLRAIEFFKPTLVVIEDIQSQSNIKTFKNLAYLQGILKNYLFINKVPYSVLSPKEWRKVLGIKGRVRKQVKEATQIWAKDLYQLDLLEDEADAVAIATSARILLSKNELKILKDF